MDRYRAVFAFVALRKESVDRNSGGVLVDLVGQWSLSARRAWIEIACICPRLPWFLSLSARRAWIEITPAISSQR